METCSNCERAIGNLETPHIFNGHVVCAQCDTRLRANAPQRIDTQIKPVTVENAVPVKTSGAVPQPLDQRLIDRLLSKLTPELIVANNELIGRAVAGDAEAINTIGVALAENPSYPRDRMLVVELCTEAAKRGNVSALANLGHCYLFGDTTLPKDETKAIKLFTRAANADNPMAMYWLGHCYFYGLGLPKDTHLAVQWLERGAAAQYASCLVLLGCIYRDGVGVAKDGIKEMDCYRRILGNPDATTYQRAIAMHNTGICYLRGRGVQQSDVAAMAWVLKSAEAGSKVSMKLVGEAYANGVGVPRSTERAQYWMNLAIETELREHTEQSRREAEIQPDAIDRSLPPAPQQGDRQNTENIVGMATGLSVITDAAGNEIGGDLIIVQATAIHGPAKVEITGLHGKTMGDSLRAVYNLIRSRPDDFGITEAQARGMVAVHLLRIASLREGPSAGLAFLVAMVSALSNRPVRPGFAFSGEVALHGEVGPVGGLAHKIWAAARAGRKHIVVPALNANALGQLANKLQPAVTIHPVETARQAVEMALADMHDT